MDVALELLKLFNQQKRYRFPFRQIITQIPENGIYVLFEEGEKYNGFDRVVRVGTHTGDKQLRSRLNQHFVNENKNRSIFRKNIGRCLLSKNQSPYLPLWELDTTSRIDKNRNLKLLDLDFEKKIEKDISEYIQTNLSFCVIKIDKKSERLSWESKIVSSLSLAKDIKPSTNWLGNYSPKLKIRESGLWQVNELYKTGLNESELELLKTILNK